MSKTGRTFKNAVLRHFPKSKPSVISQRRRSASSTASATASSTHTKAKSSEKKQTIIFTIARMNPPTPGHIELVKTLIEAGGTSKVYILLQAGEKAGKETQNPLTCGEKKKYLLEMIGSLGEAGEKVEVICADDKLDKDCTQDSDPLRQICDIYKREKYNPEEKTIFYLWVGTDRVESFKKFLGNGKYLPPNSELVTKELKRETGGISGTKMRELAKAKREEDFIKLEMEAGLSLKSAKELYDILHERMNSLPLEYKKPSTAKSASAKSASAAKGKTGTKKGGKRGYKQKRKTKRSKTKQRRKINRNKR